MRDIKLASSFYLKALLLAMSLVFTACFDNEFKAINSNESFKFAYNKLDNRLEFNQNKPFALVFFTKDCGVCKEQIAAIKALNKLYDFDFFAILADAKDRADALKWADEKGLDFTLFYEAKAARYLSQVVGGIYGVPVSAFFDKEGRQNELFIGLTPQSVLEKELLNLRL